MKAEGVKAVAFGGGHGLWATLRALRALAGVEITAVVTVADDGGSSGRLRAERGSLPPGDLRQALAALAAADDSGELSSRLFQHRFSGDDALGGHAVGNLVLVGLLELVGDPVAALEHAGRMLRAQGRVLPMSRVPLSIEADVLGADPARPGDVAEVRGQHEVAVTAGRVREVRLTPAAPPACAEAIAAVADADWLLFGPGSWYTSVIPHLLVPDLADAIAKTDARRLVILNLAEEAETAGLSLADHLRALSLHAADLRLDAVLADGLAVADPEPVRLAAESLSARLVLAPVAAAGERARHDPAALAAALQPILGSDDGSVLARSVAGAACSDTADEAVQPEVNN
ncbi:MAG: uridine diphosphate-N-acetylglucosamine-binding protein YvcK [Micromonosporaceae bacterium]|nr:uridine diphosphate-N-acetylglucosamine-binding protein YvcK [Micromonosporaceae bacterium]